MRKAEVIRFIDLGDQILEGQREFAWWDTISDTFEEFNTNQAWETWREFEEDYRYDADLYGHPHLGDPGTLERYKSLFPKEWPPPFVSAEDRKKRYEQGICDDIIDNNIMRTAGINKKNGPTIKMIPIINPPFADKCLVFRHFSRYLCRPILKLMKKLRDGGVR